MFRMDAKSQIEIKIEGLYKSFGDNEVLRGIDLELFRGEIIAIVGRSGCGKTVLLNTILGEYPFDKGDIRIFDRSHKEWGLQSLSDFSAINIDSIHKQWGVVFQRNALFSGSVFLNLALWLREIKGMKDEDILPIAERALASVGLPTSREFMEMSNSDLSGGMAKRVAIARAISMDPYVFFYDEPTTGLDPSNAANIHDLIFDIHDSKTDDGSKRTTIIITHDKDLLSRLRPRTIMLHDGKVHFDGPFEAFKNSDSEVIVPYFKMMPVLQDRFGKEIEIDSGTVGRRGLIVAANK
jgi:phospholipid/cholesterol/gamma-HCH transport system ATP-binding protein